MSNQFVVVRGGNPHVLIYIQCEACWMSAIEEPHRISAHCISLREAKQLADKLVEESLNGSRSQTFDCVHAKADSS